MGTMEVRQIQFSQVTVSKTFSDGRSLQETTRQLLTGELDISSIPAIRVVRYQGKYVTLDNRRLRVFMDALVDKVSVIICNLQEDSIKREFYAKYNNKSDSDGGRIKLSVIVDPAIFTSGVYQFTQTILSWTEEHLRVQPRLHHDGPLPDNFGAKEFYYRSFLDLILEETQANLLTGLEMVDANKTTGDAAEVIDLKLARKHENPCTLTLRRERFNPPIKANDALLLRKAGDSSTTFIALATRNDDLDFGRQISAKLIIDERFRRSFTFNKGDVWTVFSLGSVVTNLRMYDACVTAPNVSWMTQLLGRAPSYDEPKIPTRVLYQRSLLSYGYGRTLAHAGAGVGSVTDEYGYDRSYPDSGAGRAYFPKGREKESSERKHFSHLNPSQRNALEKFLKREGGIELVEGPPGTGKTTTIIALLKELSTQERRVLVSAPSNKAVQILVEAFVTKYPEVPIAFAGVEDKLPDDNETLSTAFIHTYQKKQVEKLSDFIAELWDFSPADPGEVTTIIQAREELRKLKEKHSSTLAQIIELNDKFAQWWSSVNCYKFNFLARVGDILENFKDSVDKYCELSKVKLMPAHLYQLTRQILSELMIILNGLRSAFEYIDTEELEMQMLNNANLIFATLSVVGRKQCKEMNPVDDCIIDEAAQAPEPACLIPLVLNPKRLLLVGDPKQLPATIVSRLAVEMKFDRSLMERLLACGYSSSLLDTQYRMHPEISRWPSLHFYEGLLKDAASVSPESRELADLKDVPEFLTPYAFIHVDGVESKDEDGTSLTNNAEADLIVKLVKFLSEKYEIDVATQVGVITFYAAQASLINNSLKLLFPGIRVATVDAYQGGEADIVIISCVRANSAAKIGFLNDRRRMNVALTRARFSLMIIGHKDTLGYRIRNDDWTALVADAIARGKAFYGTAVAKAITPSKAIVIRPSVARGGIFSAAVAKAPASSSEKLLAKASSAAPSRIDPQYKTALCLAESSAAGGCKYGDRCRFAHGEEELRSRPGGYTRRG